MTDRRAHLRVAADLADAEVADRGITVHEAAEMIGCDDSTVRKLIRAGRLRKNAAGLGQRRPGVRVRLLSVQEYIAAGAGETSPTPPKRTAHTPVTHTAHREAVANLVKLGLL